jgi:tubulin polyglutamylase TTLL2
MNETVKSNHLVSLYFSLFHFISLSSCTIMSDEMVLILRMSEKGPEIIRLVCLEKGWELFDKSRHKTEHWNMWWKTSRFTKSQLESCNPYQRVNHFPKTGEITRKDTLLRNLRRMKGIYGKVFDFFPEGFILPSDYRGFVRTYAEEEMEGKKV